MGFQSGKCHVVKRMLIETFGDGEEEGEEDEEEKEKEVRGGREGVVGGDTDDANFSYGTDKEGDEVSKGGRRGPGKGEKIGWEIETEFP